MHCESCGAQNIGSFNGEVAIHFPGLKNIGQPTVWVFPKLSVCLDCGAAHFSVPETELRALQGGKATTAP